MKFLAVACLLGVALSIRVVDEEVVATDTTKVDLSDTDFEA